jgi:hypothetical protein
MDFIFKNEIKASFLGLIDDTSRIKILFVGQRIFAYF